ncbi:MAG: hypothetical protein EPN91_03090 [Salinibacterium sp.]|nr:MAG: hypothetical protein EPN91_03090 [Salinibacterium sp.]
MDSFKQPQGAGEGVSEYLRSAILSVLGIRVKFIAKAETARSAKTPGKALEGEPATDALGWAVAPIPEPNVPEPDLPEPAPELEPDLEPDFEADAALALETTDQTSTLVVDSASIPAGVSKSDNSRYGEAVVRELLGASFVEEHDIAPRVVPVALDE